MAAKSLQYLKLAVARAGRGRSLLRRLPPDLGGCRFPASLEGGAKFLRRDLHRADPVLTGFARDYVRRGDSVWDIGANVGLFTFTAAGLAGVDGEIVALEADTWLVGNLRAAALKNQGRGAPVSVIPAAASQSFGIAQFNLALSARAMNHLSVGASAEGAESNVREKQVVPTLPLDSLLDVFGPPDVLKVDVEGAEPLVLAGAHKVLDHGPVLLIEAFSEHVEAIHDLLEPHGYSYVNAETRAPCARPSFNVIATVAGRRSPTPEVRAAAG